MIELLSIGLMAMDILDICKLISLKSHFMIGVVMWSIQFRCVVSFSSIDGISDYTSG